MSPRPYFGRAWRVTVDTADGTRYVTQSLTANNEEPLKVTFSVETQALLVCWTADITLHNLSPATANAFQGASNIQQFLLTNAPLQMGDQVTLSAGYQNSASGTFDADTTLIWEGPLLQPILRRVNVVESQLTLRCMLGLYQNILNHLNSSLAGGATAYDTINEICSRAGIVIADIDDAAVQELKATSFPRSQALWGKPFALIREIAQQHLLTAWLDRHGLTIRSFSTSDQFAAPRYAYGPPGSASSYNSGTATTVKQTLIDTPIQTQEGVTFRVLLDSDLQIGSTVQLVPGTIINPYPLQFNQLPPNPNPNGIYVVMAIRHYGDTRGRGEDWFTEVVCFTPGYFADFLKGGKPGGATPASAQ